MTFGRRPALQHASSVWRYLWLSAVSLIGCAWIGETTQPGWVDGANADYPPAQYLVGVGQADNRNSASDHAYAAVARIFRAEVSSHARDWESYLAVEIHGSSTSIKRQLTLDMVTKVSTDKVLENVQILETWYDSGRNLYYALAVMNRSQAAAALLERMATLDRAVEQDVTESRQAADKLAKVRHLRRAVKSLLLREAFNTDLRVIRPSGQGSPPTYWAKDLSNELEQFLATNLILAVQVSSDHAEPIQRALTEGLIREGLHVTVNTTDGEQLLPELLVQATVRLFPIEVQDPHFKYVRWCSDLEVVEAATQRVVGAVARGGREGHLTEREATAKTLRVVQQEFSSNVAATIAAHIFGEATLPMPGTMPAGCPREDLAVESHTH